VTKPFGSDVIASLVDGVRKASNEPPSSRAMAHLAADSRLSPKQASILRLLVAGRSRHEVAEELGMADSTLRTHLASILHRTGARRIEELVRRLIRADG
jgi:DNA-binding CsgD family transcriptional regulator